MKHKRIEGGETVVAFLEASAKRMSIADYVMAGLREYDWPLTKVSLRVAQMQSAREESAANERLWTEDNG